MDFLQNLLNKQYTRGSNYSSKHNVLTLLSRGLLLTLLAFAETKEISTNSTPNMISEFSIRNFPIDIVGLWIEQFKNESAAAINAITFV